VSAQTDAKKQSFSETDARKLLVGIEQLISTRGRKVTTFDLKNRKWSWKEIAPLMLGPTGKLRAPVIRSGSALLIGFDEESYRKLVVK
jgi:arsenate reductase-like glutaredoxin family protein